MKFFFPRPPRGRRARLVAAGSSLLLVFLLLAFFPGCQACYLRRQVAGTLSVLWQRKPIDESLLARVGEKEKENLLWVADIRQFALDEVGLDAGDAYTTFYDTGGAPLTTIVVASHPLALVPYQWRFPVVGRVPYKGYYNADEARAERDRLKEEGWDAVSLPVNAFSSLGWFSDPLLASMLELPRGDLAELLLHELTHRTVYFKNNTAFNESLATVVGEESTLLLLVRTFGQDSDELNTYREGLDRQETRKLILKRLRADLDALYRNDRADELKRERKVELFATANLALQRVGGSPLPEPSNSYLVLEREYSGLTPFLRDAQRALGGSPRDLVAALKELKKSRDPVADLAARIEGLSEPGSQEEGRE